MQENNEEYLEHFGVKGMKWGKNRNPGYSNDQVKRDVQIYGNRGASRINKALNRGEQISTARSVEKTRRDSAMAGNKYVRQVGKLGGGAFGAAIGFVSAMGIKKLANSSAGRKVASKLLGQYSSFAISALNNPLAAAAVSAGAAKVGYMLSGDIAVGLNMRARGYNPNRK